MDGVDVIVIGGGPAGLMAAIAAQTAGARTLMLEKGHKLGRKLGISGGGRCNVTNAKPLPELMANIPGNARFLYSALTHFSNQDIRAFFESLGIRLKEEDRGRLFPVSDKAATVVNALVDHMRQCGVEVWQDAPVKNLIVHEGRIAGAGLQDGRLVMAPAVVVATGGASVPQTGSTGDAYPWARDLGHRIVPPYPTEVPLTSDAPFISERRLMGLSFDAVTVTLVDAKGKRLTREEGDILFSHFGLTGPAALRVSHYVSTAHRKNPGAALTAQIDFFPHVTADDIRRQFVRAREHDGKKELKTRLADWVPERMAGFLMEQLGLDPHQEMAQTSNAVFDHIIAWFKRFPLPITGTLPLAKATVTGGGVSIKDIVPSTMASKQCPGLYFAGEVMDVHAHTGGYNITVAFSTGRLAGESAAAYALSMVPLA